MLYKDEMLEFNEKFVKDKDYEQYITTKYPDKHIAVISCMDTRLTELLPAALNFKNGDIKFIRDAGGVVTHPFGSVMRSLLVCIYELNVKEIMIIGHLDCGMQALCYDEMIEKMKSRGIKDSELDFISSCGIDLKKHLEGFSNPFESVRESVKLVLNHPLVPDDVSVNGFVIDPKTGRLDEVI